MESFLRLDRTIFERTLHVTLFLVNEIKISINLWDLTPNQQFINMLLVGEEVTILCEFRQEYVLYSEKYCRGQLTSNAF